MQNGCLSPQFSYKFGQQNFEAVECYKLFLFQFQSRTNAYTTIIYK